MAAKMSAAIALTHPEDAAGKKKKFYRKNVRFFSLVEKIKLWPSRSGILHGIKSLKITGSVAEITTHCGETFSARNSRNSRAARWLRNKWCACACSKCKIPDWKIEKYSSTMMTQKWGSSL